MARGPWAFGRPAVLLVAAAFAVVGCGKPPLPSRLSGLVRTRLYTGERAARMLTKMHGKRLATRSAAIGVYGREGELRVWLARFADVEKADAALRSMLDRVGSGQAPFSPPRPQRDRPNRYFSVGPNGHHVFWAAGDAVYWLEGRPDLIDRALDGLPGPPGGSWT